MSGSLRGHRTVEATPDGPEVLAPEVPTIPQAPAMPAEAGDLFLQLIDVLYMLHYVYMDLFNYNNYTIF